MVKNQISTILYYLMRINLLMIELCKHRAYQLNKT
jgi:hypothetical protein